MPYAPTNLYPRNVTLEESDELLFLGDIDKNDIIEDAQVELINSEGIIDAVIYPKTSSIYIRQEKNSRDTWIENKLDMQSNFFPIEGYKDNNLNIKTFSLQNLLDIPDEMGTYYIQTNKNSSQQAQLSYSFTERGYHSYYYLTIPITICQKGFTPLHQFSLKFTFYRKGVTFQYGNAYCFTSAHPQNTPLTFAWTMQNVEVISAENETLSLSASVLNSDATLTQKIVAIERGGTLWNSWYTWECTEMEFNLSQLKIQLILQQFDTKTKKEIVVGDFSASFSFNFKTNDSEVSETSPIITILYRNGNVDRTFLYDKDNSYTGPTETKTINISAFYGSTDLFNWFELQKNFSWNFLLTGNDFNNLVYQGEWEKKEFINLKKYNKPYPNVCRWLQLGDCYFDKPEKKATYKYNMLFTPETPQDPFASGKCHVLDIYDEDKKRDYNLLIGGLDYFESFKPDTIMTNQYLGYKNFGNYNPSKKEGGVWYIQRERNGSSVAYNSEDIEDFLNLTYNALYLKIPALINCPNYFYDKQSNTYFTKNLSLESFNFGEICEVSQTYDSSNKEQPYTYTITFSNHLKEFIGNKDVSSDVEYWLGVNNITSEITQKANLNKNTIVAKSKIPYLVEEKTITQKVYCAIERNYEYLKPVPESFIASNILYFCFPEERIIPDDCHFQVNNFPYNNLVALYTNEIKSLECKYNQVDRLTEINISSTNDMLYAIHLQKDKIERMRMYRVFVYENGILIETSPDIYSKEIDYWYKNAKPQKIYKFDIQITTIEGLVKTHSITTENNYDENKLRTEELYWVNNREELVTIRDKEEIVSKTDEVIAKYNDYISFPISSFAKAEVPPLLKPFYLDVLLNISVWTNYQNQIFNKTVGSTLTKLHLYNILKNNECSYQLASQRQVMIKQNDEDSSYISHAWGSQYQLTMQDDLFIIKDTINNKVYELITEDYMNNNLLEFCATTETMTETETTITEEFIYIDTSTANGKWKTALESDWVDMKNVSISSIDSSKLREKEIITFNFTPWKTTTAPVSEWIEAAVFGIKPNPEENNENIYEVDPEQIWYFNLDTKAENIDFTTTHDVQQTLSQYPRIGLSNANFMSQSITTKLGYLNEDDMYVRDNGEKLTKFAKFANDGNVKILRLPNGYLIPVDIQLNSNVSQYNLVGEPSDITFKWTQVADHETCVLYGWE